MTPFDKETIRPISLPESGSMTVAEGEAQPRLREKPVESVRFNFPTKGKSLTLNIKDFTSGQAMIDAAQEWADKQ